MVSWYSQTGWACSDPHPNTLLKHWRGQNLWARVETSPRPTTTQQSLLVWITTNASDGAPGLSVLRDLLGKGQKKMWICGSTGWRRVQRPKAEIGPLFPNCRTTPWLFPGSSPVLPLLIQMIINWAWEVPKPPNWASDNPSSFVKQLAIFPLPGEIRDLEAKKGLLSEEPREDLFQGSDKQ